MWWAASVGVVTIHHILTRRILISGGVIVGVMRIISAIDFGQSPNFGHMHDSLLV